ncbi:motility associated factor glycosyltransferase family protein [Paenibacillus tarimensis]|uniref:motility associated factor glycosyltransferase family protein n=1 Tax=Paenibacillus tarimensis TaxID=416012 RepID=UPI001F431CCA|nr:6-hydroxymethylpterin diphosphokinase MptE-like protein [Paenibacillus tarimensis]MCF2944118.1 DUF115 domain-containing protein [Paenibacillus tarimensis]
MVENQFGNILEDIKDFMPKLICASEDAANMLYETITEQTWQHFGDIVEGIDDLYKTLNVLQAESQHAQDFHVLHSSISRTLVGINEKFQKLNAFMDMEHYSDAGDCLRYELIPLLQQFTNELGEPVCTREQRFTTNMDFLKREYPQLYEEVKTIKRDKQRYHICYTRTGMPNLCVLDKENKPVHWYSQYDPLFEVECRVVRLTGKVENKSKILMYGFGLGYLAQQYGKVFPKQSLYIYEPDEQVFLHALYLIDIKLFFEELNIEDFIIGSDTSLTDNMLQRFSQQQGEPEAVIHPIYEKLRTAEVKEFLTKAGAALSYFAHVIYNSDLFGLMWTQNSMFNMQAVLATPSLAGLRMKFKGMTAVIVGAGPSLEEDIRTLRKLKNHALIIAAGSSIQSLLHHGIEPHLIVSIDGAEANYNVFKNMDINHIPMLFAPMIEHRITERKTMRMLHAFISGDTCANHFMGLTSEDPVFTTTHSVTGTAIQAAIYMGCEEIVLAGQDLSYPTVSMYAAGAKHVSEELMRTIVQEAMLQVENVSGTLNRTNQGMMLTLADIEKLIASFSEVRFINTSRMGAKIQHTVWESMEDVLARHEHQNIADDILINKLTDLPLYNKDRIEKTCERIRDLPKQLLLCEQSLKNLYKRIGELPILSRKNMRKCELMITAIDKEWEQVTRTDAFLGLYLRACQGKLKQFEVALPQLTAASTLREQVSFYHETMRPLIAYLIEYTPKLVDITEETLKRLIPGHTSS